MSGCDPITYHGITQNVFDHLKQLLENIGIKVPDGNEGNIKGYGVKGHFKWDGTTGLTLTVTDKPLIISDEIITKKLNDAVRDCVELINNKYSSSESP